jgi:hypothetical protein
VDRFATYLDDPPDYPQICYRAAAKLPVCGDSSRVDAPRDRPGAARRVTWPDLRAAAPYAVFAAFAVLLLRPLVSGRSLYWGDIQLYFEPMNRYVGQELAAGRLPLWNPYILSGQPLIGNPQMSVFYPSTLFLLIAPTWAALSLTSVLHVFLCGAFMYLFLRRWTVHVVPAAAGAMVYMGSGYVLGRLQFPPMVQTVAYFPLLFATIDWNIDRPTIRTRLALAVTVALTLTAGHSQVAYMAFMAAIAYAAARMWRGRAEVRATGSSVVTPVRPSEFKRCLRLTGQTLWRARPLLGAGVFGLLLAAVYLAPAIQVVHDSAREQLSVGQANRFFADFPHLLTVVFPRFTGHPATRDFWARGNAWEPNWFVGWTPLLLAGYSLLRCRNEQVVRFWVAIGLFGVWFALGSIGGLYWVGFYAIPGLSNFHDPARFLLWTTVSVSVLSAIGLDALQVRMRWRRPHTLLITATIAGPLAWFAPGWLPTTKPSNLDRRATTTSAIRAATGSHRVSLAANTLFWKRVITDGYRDYGSGSDLDYQRTANTLLSNLEMRNGIESASGYEPIAVGGHVAFEGLADLAATRREPNTARLLGMLDVGLSLRPAAAGVPVVGFRSAWAANRRRTTIRGWTNTADLDRAWLTRLVLPVDGRTRIAAALTDPDFDARRRTVVSDVATKGMSVLTARRRDGDYMAVAPVEWHEVRATRVLLDADAGGEPAMLVYAGTAFPGWKAAVDGKSTDLLCADGTLLGLPLAPGRHVVVLTYAPDMFRIGLFVSLSACGAIIGMAVFRFLTLFRHSALSARRGRDPGPT